MKKSNNLSILAFILFIKVFFLGPLYAQTQGQIFKGHLVNTEENIHIQLDLYEASLHVPNMEFIGKVHGYMYGNIYGVWLLTKYRIKENTAILRFSHDSGADSQTVELTSTNDSTIFYKAIDGNTIRKVHKRKLVKIPNVLKFSKE